MISRVSVIGGSGCGKTTLADSLGNDMELPVYHLDGVNYFPNWEERDRDDRDKIILELVKKKKWIIDGNYTGTLEKRLQASDMVIYLDYSIYMRISGVLKRYYQCLGRGERKEIPGCKERVDKEHIMSIFSWNSDKRKKIYKILDTVDIEKVLIFKNRRKLNKWYKKTFGHKIEC